MVTPSLKSLSSPDLVAPHLPGDPGKCMVFLQAEIGPSNQPGAELFSFLVATPGGLEGIELPRWGRGLLIVREFSWEQVNQSLSRLLAHAQAPTWAEVAAKLGKELQWEFDNYASK